MSAGALQAPLDARANTLAATIGARARCTCTDVVEAIDPNGRALRGTTWLVEPDDGITFFASQVGPALDPGPQVGDRAIAVYDPVDRSLRSVELDDAELPAVPVRRTAQGLLGLVRATIVDGGVRRRA